MNNEKAALWPLKKWSPYARIVDGKPHGYMIGDKQGKWCFAESAEKQIHALTAEVDALKAEWRCPECDGRDRVSSGPDLVCWQCSDAKKIEELEAEVARLSAPISDAERKAWNVYDYASVEEFDSIILARATPSDKT